MKSKTRVFAWMVVKIAAIVISGIILTYTVSEQYYHTTLDRAVDVNSNFILTQAKTHLSEDDFKPTDLDAKNKIFSDFFKGIDTSEILRIKVWSVDGTVIFSDDKALVGQNFKDNEEFQEAMEGEVVLEIKEPLKAENIEEAGYGQLMEIYVPITTDDGKIIGIIETYTSLDFVNSLIRETTILIFSIIFVSSSFLVAAVVFVFYSIRKNILYPITEIQNATRQLTSGNFDVKIKETGDDEIKNLSNDINVMAQELGKQKDALVNAERLSAIGELAARIAHDIRNPLSIIKSSAELIQMNQKRKDAQTKTNWERLERGVSRISHQIDDVLEFIRPSSLKRKPEKISTVLNGACQRIKIPSTIKINLPTSDATIPCDYEKLETVFVNLLVNSIQAIGDKPGTIDINLIEESDDVVLITVKDNGPGIQHDLIPKIFTPLFTTKQIGTGLGLSSCKNIIEKHGGSIDVASVVGRGTSFLIRLPTKTEWQNISKIADKEKLTDYISTI